jgi:hypothetical protein
MTETTSPMTAEQIRDRADEIAPLDFDQQGPVTAREVARWMAYNAQRRWTRNLSRYFEGRGAARDWAFCESISAMCSEFAALHALMALAEVDTVTADRLATQIRDAWDDGQMVGELLYEHEEALGINPEEISRLEEAWQQLPEVQAPAVADVTAYHAGFRSLLPAERLAVSVATAQAGRGDSVPPNTATALLLILKRLTGDDTQERTEEGQ